MVKRIFGLGSVILLSLMLLVAARGNALPPVAILVDDFSPQPIQGDQSWFYNRLGGDRGQIDGPGKGAVVWGKGEVTQAPDGSFLWTGSVPLTGGLQEVGFNLPGLGEVQNLNWIVIGNAGDFVVVGKVGLTVEIPSLSTAKSAFLWSYAMLLANWDAGGSVCPLPGTKLPCDVVPTGLTRDRANFPYCHFDNVSANGLQAAAAVIAGHLGFISKASAIDIVERTTEGLLSLPRHGGILPHFVTNGEITPNTEWSTLDTVIAAVALLEAREVLGLTEDQADPVQQILMHIDWEALILPKNSCKDDCKNVCLSHGYDYDGNLLPNGWCDFGGESWLANFGYAAGTGNVAEMDATPPTFNGSGFIDEIAWLLVPAPVHDHWGIKWRHYRKQAADHQLAYYGPHTSCYGHLGLFGLSAAEVPDPSVVDPKQIYLPMGVGGEIPPNDGTDLVGYPVVAPHYAGIIASVRRAKAISMWKWLRAEGLFSPLNNVESLMLTDEVMCSQVVWNALKGSWNLSLQALGWGRFLAGHKNPLYKGMQANALLGQAYKTMISK